MRETNSSPLWRVGRAAAIVVVALVAVLWVVSWLPGINPFTDHTEDRSQPVLLKSVRDLSEYHAAEGQFQVVVDLEHDVAWVPDIIAGSRTLFIAAGSVDAYVDFKGLSDKALTVDSANKTVEIQLPAPKLDKPNIDQEHTYLYSQDRGVWDRVKSLFDTPDQKEFYVLAEKKIGDAAKSADLTKRAERNTRQMLTGLLNSLGYTVEFPNSDT